MKVAVMSITRDRLDLTRKSFKMLRQWAGMPFDHFVADNASKSAMRGYLQQEKKAGHIKVLDLHDENIGQNLAMNDLLDRVVGYDYIMRWDPDAIPRTRRFLKKLVKRTTRMLDKGVFAVTAPEITKLKHPPPPIKEGELDGLTFQEVEILGGICRLHPMATFKVFRFSQFAPLGFGEAIEMAEFVRENGGHMIRCMGLEVEHYKGEDHQKVEYPDEFTWERREVPRHISYGL